MTIVNFTITNTLDEQIKRVVKEKGFQSKAELFRVAVLDYLSRTNKPALADMNEDEKFDYLSEKLARLLIKWQKKNAGKKLPTLEEQLKSI